ncbi:MAG: helix-turn-helix transcriptional regulator, partial [Phycisphaerae bacterium]|nr:helix-turn-helix transcriptional regulator [Phycisphaerae bacterium]
MKTRTQRDYEERILRVLVHIQAHLDEAFDLDELAAIACFSPFHFHRVFRGMVGEPVKEHVRRLRLERAAYRLKTTAEQVTRLAFDAGYETHESFTRAFSAHFGQAPSQYRELHRVAPVPSVRSGVHYA